MAWFNNSGTKQTAAPGAGTQSAGAQPGQSTNLQGAPSSQLPGSTDGSLPGSGNQPGAGVNPTTPPASPMDKFGSLWSNGNAGQPSGTPKSYVNADPAKISEAVGRMNFAGSIKQELLQAIAQGGDSAMQALPQVLNTLAQQLMNAAMLGSSRLVDQAITNSRQDFMSEIPGLMRHQNATSQLLDSNPGLTHPNVRPLIEVLAAQFGNQYPEATSAELQQMATEYLQETANILNPVSGQGASPNLVNSGVRGNLPGRFDAGIPGQGNVQSMDWDNFFNIS